MNKRYGILILLPLLLLTAASCLAEGGVPDYLIKDKQQNLTPLLQRPYDFEDDFDSYPVGYWTKEGQRYGKWELVYYGISNPNDIAVGIAEDSVTGNKVFSARPEYVHGDTRAVLVRTNQAFSGDIEVSADMVTMSQNRGHSTPVVKPKSAPGFLGWLTDHFKASQSTRTGPGKKETGNTWESAWLIWNYTDDDHFNYVYLKPGQAGGELGKRDTIVRGDRRCSFEGGQCFLFTQNFPEIPLGEYAHIRVVQVGARISVYINGKTVVKDFIDDLADGPETSGHVALYTEDSLVHFDNIKVRALALKQPEALPAEKSGVKQPHVVVVEPVKSVAKTGVIAAVGVTPSSVAIAMAAANTAESAAFRAREKADEATRIAVQAKAAVVAADKLVRKARESTDKAVNAANVARAKAAASVDAAAKATEAADKAAKKADIARAAADTAIKEASAGNR